MRSRPFLARLIAPFAVLMALIVGVCGAAIHWSGERTTRLQQIQDLDRLTILVRQWIRDAPNLDEADRRRLADAARVLNTRITLIDGQGRVAFDTDATAETMSNHNNRPEVVTARTGAVGSAVRHSSTLDETAVYVAELVEPDKPDGMVIRLSYRQHTWARLGTSAWAVVGGAMVAAVLALALLWAILLRQWIGPTYQLAEAAELMAAGEWGRRVEPAGADALRFFSTRLNLVAAHAQRQLADLRRQRADLQALVDTFPDPILVSDARGKVTHLNPPAGRLLDLSPARAIGEAVVHVVNDEALLQLIERVRQDDRKEPAEPADSPAATLVREVRLNRGGQWITYQAAATRTADGGALLVLRDVSALTAAVQMKTDFVANASHELRTPIAAIKIAFETLHEVYTEDPAQTERCVQIIGGHLVRLEEMLRDLLDLSRVESSNLKPHVRAIKTTELFAQIRGALGPMAQTKLVELRLGAHRPGEPAPAGWGLQPDRFYGDERLLNLVLKNLVENSIKFTPPGGSVSVCIRQAAPDATTGNGSDAPVVVTVGDTGIGIPAEHVDRVFERFYQVDAARSGSAGRGTGLGLAIVKHAVAALGGTVQLESRVGEGTTVTCTLPQAKASADDEHAEH